ncbi:hypothetical protein DFJ74DRAFT_703120 [Hyaloraphidium curvatum]|nr:hypothetical protein DFJ74DRAFT_703120 [Hyaloraphidium curvatum]
MDPGYEVRDLGGVLGRAMFATRPFAVGQLIFREAPLLVVPRFRDGSLDVPPKLAKIVSAVAAMNSDVDLPVELTVNILVLVARRSAEPDAQAFLTTLDDFARPGKNQAPESWLNPITDLVASKCKSFVPEMFAALSERQISDCLLSCATNAHSFETDEGPYVGLYSMGSKLAHSCVPNTLQVFEANDILHYALRSISPGDMIAINYGFAEDIRSVFPTPLRRARLSVSKFFHCECLRCTAPDTNRMFRCPKCDEAAVAQWDFAEEEESAEQEAAIDSTSGHPYRCEKCAAVFAPEAMPLAEEQEEQLYHAIDATCKTAHAKLGGEHWVSVKGRARATDAAYKARRKELARQWFGWAARHVSPYFPHYFARMLCSEISDVLDEACWREVVASVNDAETYLEPQFLGPVFSAERREAIKAKLATARAANQAASSPTRASAKNERKRR